MTSSPAPGRRAEPSDWARGRSRPSVARTLSVRWPRKWYHWADRASSGLTVLTRLIRYGTVLTRHVGVTNGGMT